VGEAARIEHISNAAGRPAAHSHASGFALTRFPRDRHGTTAIEYALVAGSVSIVIVTAVTLIGQQVLGFFQGVTGL
jgi:pilus assembly protein Flp/PilA